MTNLCMTDAEDRLAEMIAAEPAFLAWINAARPNTRNGDPQPGWSPQPEDHIHIDEIPRARDIQQPNLEPGVDQEEYGKDVYLQISPFVIIGTQLYSLIYDAAPSEYAPAGQLAVIFEERHNVTDRKKRDFKKAIEQIFSGLRDQVFQDGWIQPNAFVIGDGSFQEHDFNDSAGIGIGWMAFLLIEWDHTTDGQGTT